MLFVSEKYLHILLNISTHKMWFFYVQKVLLFPLLIWRIQTLYVSLDSQCPRDYWPLVHTHVTNNLFSFPTQHFLKTVANCTTSQVSFYSVPFWVSLWLVSCIRFSVNILYRLLRKSCSCLISFQQQYVRIWNLTQLIGLIKTSF